MRLEDWELINKLRSEIYLGKSNKWIEDSLKLLGTKSQLCDDSSFKTAIETLNDDFKNLSAKQKLLWLTSRIGNCFYPPLDVDVAGPICWSNELVCPLVDLEVASKYTEREMLTPDNEGSVEQCHDIEDCSLVSSLINISMRDIELPKIKQVNDNIYHLNMFFNGSLNRLVSVDISKIPSTKEGKQLSISSDNWRSKIAEAAYLLTFTGSYGTKGSNTAIDTSRLTGYFPEIANLQMYSIDTIIKYFNSEVCLLALGTGSDLGKNEKNLIKNHDYPVVDIDKNSRRLFLRDPLDRNSRIEIDENDFQTYFQQLYLNWDTSKLFKYNQSLTFVYKSDSCNQFMTIFDKPLFKVENRSSTTETAWILLENHLTAGNEDSTETISYLQEIPENILNYIIEPPIGAYNVGLQLIKLEIPPNSDKKFFCHSSNNATLTLHIRSISKHITVKKFSNSLLRSQIQYELTATDVGRLNKLYNNYYLNPTFQLLINSNENTQKFINIQLLSGNPNNLLNFQVYAYDDYELIKPIMPDSHYEHQRYSKEFVPLFSNKLYKIVCSTYQRSICDNFSLNALFSNPIDNNSNDVSKTIELKQVYTEYGEMPFQNSLESSWSSKSTRKKIKITSMTKTKVFIRFIPQSESRTCRFRFNIFDSVTHELFHEEHEFIKIPIGGKVIPDLDILENSSSIVLMEKDDDRSSKDIDEALKFNLLISSNKKVFIYEL
ncbi:hypothetical protein Kpol_1032p73 [Vanderwaltozyma polyspora DSM 70294]|uniref:Cysteine protease RIM13 n=1 Tax=Vanderwaltozyma polyspora (strain ATCC 22028 / DSM 70294 / BCRC 21397 / CBS 2163 / NBRC 10782 / NRRL Y-8283 / UCD 57-17) TaxID=436907 RepID=A7TH25_VANPO|nr:uncharacterized protein Kpol_1032p73 [Vanderwaltozyma polyspora DSM 70294]EDO18477.1 hypothetical protein Kpol_1032p73 [Vanderwaltozyma polyspora DSM 70294]